LPHITSESAVSRQLQGVDFVSFVTTDTGSARLAAWRADFPPNTSGAAHSMSQEEVLHVLSGQLEVEIDDERFTARVGDAVLVPAGARFVIGNRTEEPAQAWVVTSTGMTAVMADSGQRIVPPWAQ
jgi:quercetin dioxygenase-like cupin family protein